MRRQEWSRAGSRGMRSGMWMMAIAMVVAVWVAWGQRKNPQNFEFVGDEGWGSWKGVLTGRITDKTGRPLAGVRVRVHSKNMETRTDRNGFFTFRGLQQGGRYSLVVDARGYDDALLRWIPIPRTHSADIGDYYLEELTNFWQVTSNIVAEGVWSVTSNMVEIVGSYTSAMTYAEWMSSNVMMASAVTNTGETGEMPMILEQPMEGGGSVATNGAAGGTAGGTAVEERN